CDYLDNVTVRAMVTAPSRGHALRRDIWTSSSCLSHQCGPTRDSARLRPECDIVATHVLDVLSDPSVSEAGKGRAARPAPDRSAILTGRWETAGPFYCSPMKRCS